jgi:hypothetical protein
LCSLANCHFKTGDLPKSFFLRYLPVISPKSLHCIAALQLCNFAAIQLAALQLCSIVALQHCSFAAL